MKTITYDETQWKLMPVSINEDMHVAAVRTIAHCSGNDDFPRRVYDAMFAVAPTPPAVEVQTAPEGSAYGIIDPDYARAYSIIRCTAWSYGYATGMHGSFTRDLDLILVPWTEECGAKPEHLINLLAERTGLTIQHGSPGLKPHGRQAWTLLFRSFGDPRWIDISFVPLPAPTPLAVEQAITVTESGGVQLNISNPEVIDKLWALVDQFRDARKEQP